MVDPVHILMLEWCGGGAGSSLCWPGSSPAMLFYAVLPHNMAVTKTDDIYTRPLAIRMRGTVNWWAGWSVLLYTRVTGMGN